MRIATWNVYSGTVADRVAELNSIYDTDIVGMQETAEPTSVQSNSFWAGDLKHKGVSVFSKLSCTEAHIVGNCSPTVAVRVTDSPLGFFNLLNVWAKPTPSYFADLSRTFDQYAQFIRERPTIILGDFNMSLRIQQVGKQFHLLNGRLSHDFDVHSAYHAARNEKFGMETGTTLYHQWGAGGCFHCDFIYIPSAWIPRLASVTLPGYNKFDTSDHRPVVCDFA